MIDFIETSSDEDNYYMSFENIKTEKETNIIISKKNYRKPKKSFPLKRNPYRDYMNAEWNINDVLNETYNLELDGEHKYIKKISSIYNICEGTLKRIYQKWKKDKRPYLHLTETRGLKKLFSEQQELDLYEYIKAVYINGNLFFDDECLQILAKKKWDSLYPDKDLFKGSRGWVYYFKERWNLSSFIAQKLKNNPITGDNDIENYYKKCKEAYLKNSSFLFNMDETFWRILNGAMHVIGIKGTGKRNLLTNINEKEGFTSIFLITADGLIHKTIIIIKGTTNRCLSKTGLLDDSKLTRKYSKNGWIDDNIMKFILDEIFRITKGEQGYLILDQYTVHTKDEIIEYAKNKKVDLIYVPVGKTATMQPLDVGFNGPLKMSSMRVIKEIYLSDPFAQLTIKTAVGALIESLNNMRQKTTEDCFKKACKL